MRFILLRANPDAALAATAQCGAKLLRVGQPLRWPDLARESCFVIPLGGEGAVTSAPPPTQV
jgi:cyclic beta-1,2-glucan synthetase